MLLAFKNIGITTAPHKTQGLEFMRIVLDYIRMEARLPPDKVERLSSCFASFKGRKSCTLKELLCLQSHSSRQTLFAAYDSAH
jgi:hypothetical protein